MSLSFSDEPTWKSLPSSRKYTPVSGSKGLRMGDFTQHGYEERDVESARTKGQRDCIRPSVACVVDAGSAQAASSLSGDKTIRRSGKRSMTASSWGYVPRPLNRLQTSFHFATIIRIVLAIRPSGSVVVPV
jgi:hypothetical protein